MTDLFPEIPQDFSLKKQSELIRLTFEQLNKDLNASRLQAIDVAQEILEISKSIQGLRDLLTHEIDHGGHKMQQLFYRVDVDEKRLSSILRNEEGVELVEALIHLILQREFQKVMIRLSWGD